MSSRAAMQAGQPWLTLGLFLLAAGMIVRTFATTWLPADLGDLMVGFMLGVSIGFLVVALVLTQRAKSGGVA